MHSRVTQRRWLFAGAVLLSSPAVAVAKPQASAPLPAAPPAAQSARPVAKEAPDTHPKPARKTLHDRLLAAEKALAMAGNEKDARQLSDHAEELRSRALTGAVRMLVSDAQDALQKHEFQTAEDNLTAAITLQPDQPVLRRQRAAARIEAGDSNGAVADLAVTLQADPGDPDAWALLAEAERERHEPEAALRAFHQVLLLDPKTPHADDQLKKLQKDVDGQAD
ncbi:tetratricopeptide repeat protein [Gluconobacter wancherniae]|uniref:Uncharacterized protein n=1 Tax=Gluconobacter wancherniae NBRC 103581 TaxID=656744 RepID=A0A511B3C2_9PROT|nr:tetratricopeptide repeat protein [Gluconobacter wancherniae]MBF0854160.1 tetratricopeptide repeat protein [Gluconobacter wancherniae]MBS1062552.1 tetratricopeptide repeat protein [Gluconobacter wancherniae]MBS1088711.1 tetratricopeptide repeat protein [Gluconobacter wancherniae]MBS1094690.1 tetratricopeptide repeat protein [Gluconobacter wancherniae]GBD57216.1 hypothetical protein NBRC103581_01802 [Gluconobacter wancherniae NBRC 103581]